MATKVVVGFGPSNICYSIGLWEANVARVYGWTQPPWGCLLGGNLWCSQIQRVVGSMDLDMDILALLPLLSSLLWLGQSPIDLLELSLD